MENTNNETDEEQKRQEGSSSSGEEEQKGKSKQSKTKGKSSLGIDENIAGLLCYVLGWVTGIIMLVAEKESKFVKFHAMQSLIVFLAIFIIGMIPIGWILDIILFPLALILWVLLMYKAYQGERFKLPIVGDFAEKQAYGEE